jgi:ligand-binding sensor domain-containing protein
MLKLFFRKPIAVWIGAILLTGCQPSATSPSPSAAEKPPVPTSGETAPAVSVHPVAYWNNFDTGANVKALAFEGDYLWMGLPNGVIRYDTRTQDNHTIYTPASTNGGLVSKGIYYILVDPKNGAKWIATYGGGLARFDGTGWRTYTVSDGLADQWVYDMEFDRQGRMWVATWKGVSVFDGNRITNYTEKDGLIDKWVYSIVIDQDGLYWFGTESGLNRFDGKTWSSYTHKDGLGAEVEGYTETKKKPSPSETATASGKEASGYSEEGYGSGGGGHHADPSKRNLGANPNFVIAGAVDRQNRKWFGTWGAGVSSFDGTAWKTYTVSEGLGGNFIHVLEVDRDGRIWAGTNGGVSWFDGQKWRTLTTRDGLLDNNVFSIAFDKSGRYWFGTWKGLSHYSGPLPL